MDVKLYNDFIALAIRQFATGDFDAEHPLYLDLISSQKIAWREGVWLSFLYMAYYDEASAWITFLNSDPFTLPSDAYTLNLPIGTNRRNLYGGKIKGHFASLRTEAKKSKDWPIHNFVGNPVKDWDILKQNINEVYGNGRFGTFTTAEMIQKVNGADVEITGFDNDGSSAPADGVSRIYKCDRNNLQDLDKNAEKIYGDLLRLQMNPFYTKTDRGVTESVLCNLSGMCRGRFYSGRNLDRQQQRIKRVEGLGYTKELKPLWEARKQVFQHDFLGELNGWEGISKPRLTAYRDEGKLLWTYDER